MRSVGVWLIVILAGCAAPSPSLSPAATSPTMTSPQVSAPASPGATPAPFAERKPDDVLLLRANTQLWTVQEERIVTVPASIVVYADGLVIADVNPTFEEREWRAIELTPQELESLAGTIAATRPQRAQLAAQATCADCGVIVIRARATGGELVEMAVAGLLTEDPHFPVPPDVPPSMLALSRTLDSLQFLVESRSGVATEREVPQIPAGAYIGG